MSDPVLELLKEKNVHFTISGKDYVTKCFNPEHDDSNPSFRIDRTSGIAHCFSCGYKTNLFKFYGILTNNVSIRVAKLKEKLADLRQSSEGLDALEGSSPFNGTFRGISSKTLKEFGACKTDRVPTLEDRIIFPIPDVRGKTAVYVARHTLSNANPRYVMYPPGASLPIFSARLDKGITSIVLVEGIFDLLNTYDKGLRNVVCTFGTGGLLNNTAEKLLPYKVQGITKVFILYDGDEAGRIAAAKIKPLIEEAEFTVEIINLPDGVDPGELDQDNVDSLIEYTQ